MERINLKESFEEDFEESFEEDFEEDFEESFDCPNCLANFHALKERQERVEVLYDALLKLLSDPKERTQALSAIHFLEEGGE